MTVMLAEEIVVALDRLKGRGDELLLEHTELRRRPDYPGIAVFSAYGNYLFQTLSEDGMRLQTELLQSISRGVEVVEVLLRYAAPSIQKSVADAKKTMLELVEQDHAYHSGDKRRLAQDWAGAISVLVDHVRAIYGHQGRHPVLIPDTNAILSYPNPHEWTFNGFPTFQVLVLSTVLSELDELKVNHRNEEVRGKARDRIRQLKGYRERGERTRAIVTDGIPLRTGVATMLWRAAEPRKEGAPSWLDLDNMDDRIIASAFEVAVEEPGSSVVILSADINLQNKAAFSFLPYLERPE